MEIGAGTRDERDACWRCQGGKGGTTGASTAAVALAKFYSGDARFPAVLRLASSSSGRGCAVSRRMSRLPFLFQIVGYETGACTVLAASAAALFHTE